MGGKTGQVRIGISGWTYRPWRGVFYPKGLPQKRELGFAAESFPTVEINGTFYGTQRPESYARWAEETPDGFVFAVKGPRYITHLRRLREVEAPLANFLASGPLRLGPKLGPILWQFPPSFRFDEERIEAFLELLPKDTEAAAEISHRHDERYAGRVWTRTDRKRPMRHAMEIRHDSFLDPAFIRLLRRYGVALVCADTVDWPRRMDLTADFIYCRLHGSEQLYVSGYDDEALDSWADRVAAWATGGEPADAERVVDKPGPKRAKRDVYVYFDNDAKVRAPADAKGLIRRVEDRLGG
ncbi:uncharacterized protein YecE (DUF72 family) [Inquilinus ginsengisoli]|uniref:DUF72 domain-containing protein n=1 Tax=Inquilinus ginsengisoli TaxID=363840 RepID=UPI003D25C286